MLGQMQALGLSPEQIESMLLRLKGEQSKVSSRVYANGETSR